MSDQILLENADLLDVEADVLREGTNVLIEDGMIREVSESPIRGENARRIDLRGKKILPGLIDAHVHVTITAMDLGSMVSKPRTLVAIEATHIMRGMLERGFTTVRDAAGADWGIAAAADRNLVPSPRLYHSGFALSQTGGHGDFRPRLDGDHLCACEIHTQGIAHVADGVPAVRKAAREELRRGAKQIKIMASGGVASPTDPIWNVQYSAEEMRAIVEEAAGWKTYAMAHAYTPEAITRAVEAGVRTIEHGNLIDRPTAELMAERGAYLVPTLVTYFKIEELGQSLGFPKRSLQKLQDVLHQARGSLEICRDAGVPMGFGTDLLGETHVFQSDEFRIRGEVLPAIEVLRSATLVNAEILGETGRLGVIAAGAHADLLVVDVDPREDLSVLSGGGERLLAVMKAGEFAVNRLDA